MMQTEQLYKQYSDLVRIYLARFVGEVDAVDLMQEVFIKIDQGLDSFRAESNIKTWIYSIATNVAKDFLKSKSYRQSEKNRPISEEELSEYDDEQVETFSPESIQQTAQMNQCINEFIHRLPYSYSSVLVLSELEGYGANEIAEVLDISPGTAKVRLHRARARLKQELEAGCVISVGSDAKLKCDPKDCNS